MNLKRNFLHNHPVMETKLGLDKNHVIVDKKDWEYVHKMEFKNGQLINHGFEKVAVNVSSVPFLHIEDYKGNLTIHPSLLPNNIPELVDCSNINKLEELPKFDYDFLHTEMLRTEEKLITEVLSQVLKRPPTIEDFKLVTKASYAGDEKHYKLLYNDIKLGWVTLPSYEFNNHFPKCIGFTFKPCV